MASYGSRKVGGEYNEHVVYVELKGRVFVGDSEDASCDLMSRRLY